MFSDAAFSQMCPFTDEDRNRISIRLTTEEGVMEFFRKNRDKLSYDIENVSKVISNFQNTIKINPDIKLGGSDLLGILEILTSQAFKTVSDVMDITEIAFLQQLQLRKEIEEVKRQTR